VQTLAKADQRPLFVIGESLGSGSACAMAREFPQQIAGVGLVVPFGSLLEVASFHYPFIPVKLVLRDRFDNVAALEKYRGHVAFVIAGADEVVTAASGLRLHEQYAGPKHLRTFPGLRHNDVDYSPEAPWWREMSDFLTSAPQA
jgi:pimeloyl-ACP methyl ester carboxylesterase